MTATANPAQTIGCNQCGGRLLWRVVFAGFPASADNFDQLVDHNPRMFTLGPWLRSVAARRDGSSVTVWRLADAAEGGDWAEATVVAYAGPHPGQVPGRTWLTDPSGHGIFADLAELECEGHESLAGEHMGESVFCDGSCQQRIADVTPLRSI